MTSRVTPLAFDSDVLGIPCGRLELSEGSDIGSVLPDLVAGAWSRGIRHLTARIPSEWSAVSGVLRTLGFQFVLSSLSLDRVADAKSCDEPSVSVYEGDDDVRLREITRSAFTENTRFHLEPAFAKERVWALYERWIQNLIENDVVKTFVHRDGDDITGYVTVEVSDGPYQGHIGLIAVDPKYHGRGIGGRLLRSVESGMTPALRKFSVMTESMNTRALRLYARAGYSVCRSWDVLHAYRRNDNGHGTRPGEGNRETAHA